MSSSSSGNFQMIDRDLFDQVIDCLYEYDLGQELPERWPPRVRAAITAARLRILEERGA
jgi:hypothetical protein